MQKCLIVLIGEYRLIRQATKEYAHSHEGVSYFPSLVDELEAECERLRSTDEFYEQLSFREIERDETVLKKLEAGGCAIVEQWHAGNLACTMIRAPSVAGSYEMRFDEQLRKFDEFAKRFFYVSCDVDKLIDAEIPLKREELSALSVILKSRELPIETIDGETLPQNIEQRLAFLLNQNP